MIFVNKKYIYGLDLSMANSGISIFNLNTYKPVLITSVSTNAKDEHGKRLHTQREYMKELIEKHPPYEIAIERSFTRFNNATQILYRCHGVVNELFYNYPQFYYAPNAIKKIITGNGQSNKSIVAKKILEKYPYLKFANNDESDATAIAICHLIKKHKMKWQ